MRRPVTYSVELRWLENGRSHVRGFLDLSHGKPLDRAMSEALIAVLRALVARRRRPFDARRKTSIGVAPLERLAHPNLLSVEDSQAAMRWIATGRGLSAHLRTVLERPAKRRHPTRAVARKPLKR